MMEKIKNFYGSHPIRWTLLTLAVVIAIALLIWYAPAFSMKAAEIPVQDIPATEKGEMIPLKLLCPTARPAERAKPSCWPSRPAAPSRSTRLR